MDAVRKSMQRALRGERYFRWRGGDISRIEGLADGVIALAMTLLVISSEVPKTFQEMTGLFRQLPSFLVCSLILLMVWWYHFQFHRRFGLEDLPTVALNGLLLLLLLFYVYPLKFLFDQVFSGFAPIVDSSGTPVPSVERGDIATLMWIYGFGYAAIFVLFSIMNWRAWLKRDLLELTQREQAICRSAIREHLIHVAFGVISGCLSIVKPSLAPISGVMYFGLGPVQGLHGWRSGVAMLKLPADD